MKKALMVASVASMINEFNIPNIKILIEQGYEVTVACNFKKGSAYTDEKIQQLLSKLEQMNVKYVQINFERSPFSKVTFSVYKKIKSLVEKEKFNLIHVHTPVSGILTRLAARKCRKTGTKVIYTAHGFHFYKGAPLLNWLIYYPVEKICAYFTDVLITINKEDYKLATNKFKAKQILYVPGVGIDTEKFNNITVNRPVKRKELGFVDENIMLLSVGELNKNKNHQVIIRALGQLHNNNIHYCIAGVGNEKDELLKIAKENKVENNIHLLGFRMDIGELLRATDIFCFPSLREGLSVALMEAMSAGIPCIVSDIRGNTDLIVNLKGGYIVNTKKIDDIARVIEKLAKNTKEIIRFGEYNKKSIQNFDIEKVNVIMRKIYLR